MNYYEHHLGDYLRDTAHLSMLEDGAYRRLLDAYYIKEAPLPKALRDVCRLVRAMTKPERDAVAIVLAEFFREGDDAWHHKRCDAEIARYKEALPDREAKRENERERQRRARDRRKHLFESLREFGIVPAYETQTIELQRLLSHAQSQRITQPVTQPVTRDNMATQTPDTRHQTPDTNVLIPLPPTGGCPIEPAANPTQPDPVDEKTGLPDCPYTQLLKLWAKHLPHLTQPRVWEGNRKATMRQRWQQAAKPSSYSPEGYATEEKGIAWWDSFFGYIANDTTLAHGFSNQNRTWKPDLEWVCNAANFQKIIDGKYTK